MSKKIIQLNEGAIKDELKELVRGSVEETLNNLLEKEARELTQAARYERTEARHVQLRLMSNKQAQIRAGYPADVFHDFYSPYEDVRCCNG
ncbi:hypothetical protein SDC9_59656 [bioreactor metagenome]|uniref:Uncharacterized protein n=1 Tax=bioreactor metagenome TaxID=1076179 RepID=A0A644XAS1_9ZZZZ